jgi:hypothetical protein
MPRKNPNAGVLFGTDIAMKIWSRWDIWEIIGISDKRRRRFRHDFRLNHTRVVALLVGRHAIGLPIRRFGCGRIMQFPPGCMAARLLLIDRQLGEAAS